MKKSFGYRASRAIQTFVTVSGILFSVGAHALLLQINPTASHVTYTPGGFSPCYFDSVTGSLICPPSPTPETAALSGQIELNITHEHWEFGSEVTDRDILSLTTIGFSAGVLSSKFPLAGTLGIISGETFEVRDDPCFLAPFPSMCGSTWYSTVHWGADGTWDGHSLTWIGYSSENFGDSLAYTINAEIVPQTSAVPEPGSLRLLALAIVGLGICRRRRVESH